MSPVEFYPAMWYDIGPSTAAARSMLFGLRAELLSVSFVKRVADWCAAHKIDASGHPAGDYEVSPMGFSGDALKFYQHPQRPLLDVIGAYGDKRDGYKLSGSAAFIYDKPILQCETYGAFEGWKEANFTPDLLYRTAMELYARGINLIIPHGVWYAHPNVPTPPEISWRNPIVAASLPAYNTWAARCQLILQGGRHVADIAVLYPITAIYADCYFRNEGTDPEYLNVGERLTHSTIPPFHHSTIPPFHHSTIPPFPHCLIASPEPTGPRPGSVPGLRVIRGISPLASRHPSAPLVAVWRCRHRLHPTFPNETITFASIPAQAFSFSPVALVATSSSKLPVAFSVVSGQATANRNSLTWRRIDRWRAAQTPCDAR